MKSTSRKLSRRVVVTEEGGREGKSRERERRERGESTEAAMVSVDPLSPDSQAPSAHLRCRAVPGAQENHSLRPVLAWNTCCDNAGLR